MSVALTDSIDIARVAANRLHLTQSVSLAQLERLVETLGLGQDAAATLVDCELDVGSDGADGVKVTGSVKTRWPLTCQRCLERFDDAIALSIEWRSGALPDGDFELGGEPIRLIDWVEDELLLALPAIPKHADRADCEAAATKYLTASDGPPMRTPFADLKNMLDEKG
ncbi:MAG: DUF177 domain-containing protein [Gammaproteobacteria bacterium]